MKRRLLDRFNRIHSKVFTLDLSRLTIDELEALEAIYVKGAVQHEPNSDKKGARVLDLSKLTRDELLTLKAIYAKAAVQQGRNSNPKNAPPKIQRPVVSSTNQISIS